MSIIKSIKQQLGLGGTASEQHFWDGSVPNQLSLKRGTPEAPGAELIKALNGVLSFPNQGQSLTGNGYVKLPGGLIVQWGAVSSEVGSGNFPVVFPVEFPTICVAAHAQGEGGTYIGTAINARAPSGFNGVAFNTASGAGIGVPLTWIALGY